MRRDLKEGRSLTSLIELDSNIDANGGNTFLYVEMQANVKITLIYGRAGTGKSTALAKMIQKCVISGQEFVVLTATHSALNNIYAIVEGYIKGDPNVLKEYDLRSRFRTIYSFFRIDYERELVAGCVRVPSYVFIDEFSLINKKLFKKMLYSIEAKATGNVSVVLTGDMLQLNAIYKQKQYVSFHKLHRLCHLSKKIPMLMVPVIEHVHLSIFGLKGMMQRANKKQLTVNYRNSTYVGSVLNAIYAKDTTFDYPFVDDVNECVALINSGYVFISSMYKHIQNVYDALGKVWKEQRNDITDIDQPITFRAGLKRLHLFPDIEIMITTTSKIRDNDCNPVYYNGEYVRWTGKIDIDGSLTCVNTHGATVNVLKEVDESLPCKPTYYPVIPRSLITVHKAQGQTIENVIVCIDDVFDMCMLYTAITRAKNDVRFYTTKGAKGRGERLFDSAYTTEFKQLTNLLAEMNGKLIADEQDDIEY